MRYKEALDFVEKNQHLKGTIDDKGFLIGDIIIVPSDEKKRDMFLQRYTLTGGGISCNYSDEEDVEIWAIDTAYLEKANVLFYNKLSD